MIYKEWMAPYTFVARDRHDMIKQINVYGREKIGAVVTKQDRFNCGIGVHIWPSIEHVYNQLNFGHLNYPFVLQPFINEVLDVRVIIIGDYNEAYWRHNPYSFRNNIFFGGNSGEYELSPHQWDFCQNVMERGKFPNAHIDLMVTKDKITYLSEINLRGGLKGAKISGAEYRERINALEDNFINSIKTAE
jgi:ribosomal protein S6--L-glutamate ligase